MFRVCSLGSWRGRRGGVLQWLAISWIIRWRGCPPSPLLRKAKLKVAPLELPFVINFLNKFGLHPWETSSYQAWSFGADHFLWREWGKKPLTSLIFFHLFSRWPVWPRNLSHQRPERDRGHLRSSMSHNSSTLTPCHRIRFPFQSKTMTLTCLKYCHTHK